MSTRQNHTSYSTLEKLARPPTATTSNDSNFPQFNLSVRFYVLSILQGKERRLLKAVCHKHVGLLPLALQLKITLLAPDPIFNSACTSSDQR
jgi:hypothetical protein